MRRNRHVLPATGFLALATLAPFACVESDPSPTAPAEAGIAPIPDGSASRDDAAAIDASTPDTASPDAAGPEAAVDAADDSPSDATVDASDASDASDATVDASDASAFSTTFHVALGNTGACAVFPDGRMKCWGLSSTGEASAIGDGPNEMGANLLYLTLAKRVRRVSGGTGDTLCVIWEDGNLRCWGGNLGGQTGITNFTLAQVTTDVDLGVGRTAIDVSVGTSHACAVLDDGSVKCWGSNSEGQLGQGDTTTRVTPPVLPIPLGTGVTAKSVVAGNYFSCALLNSDRLKCWGRGNNTVGDVGQGGQLAIANTAHIGNNPGEMGDNLPFAKLGTNPNTAQPWKVLKYGLGDVHACALLENNRVKCWGRNDGYPYVGSENSSSYGSTAPLSEDGMPFVNVGTDPNTAQPWVVKDLMVSRFAACVILANDTIRCWGTDLGVGLLGKGTLNASVGDNVGEMGDQLAPVALGTGKVPTTLYGTDYRICARVGASTLNCWGRNYTGGLGQGTPYSGATIAIGDVNGEMGAALVDTLLE